MSSQEVSREQKERPVLNPLATAFEFNRRNFDNPALEWRRLFSEVLGTFLLVLVGAGGSVVNAVSNGAISRTAGVTAPGLMVLAIILFMGAISGAHLNPAVSIAFATRGDFPWWRVPGYIIAQLVGSTLAVLLLWAMFGKVGMLGATEPGPGISDLQALLIEFVLTAGLVSTILGTASQSAKPRANLGFRCGRVHHPRRALVEPDQWGVDESGAIVRPGSGAPRLLSLLGVHRGSDRGWAACRGHRLHPAGPWGRFVRRPSCAGKIGGDCSSFRGSARRKRGDQVEFGRGWDISRPALRPGTTNMQGRRKAEFRLRSMFKGPIECWDSSKCVRRLRSRNNKAFIIFFA